MIGRAVFVAALLCASAPALAQGLPPPSPWAPLQDRPTCTRAELKAATDAYVTAQRTGNIAALPLDPNAHFLENMATVEKDKGLWNTALPIANAMSFHDDKRCKTFTEMIVTEGGHPYVIGTRLYLHQGRIIRVDSLVTDKGDWLFNANAYLKYTRQEDWSDLFKYQKSPPGTMIAGANAYLDGFADKFTDIPWGTPCARLEGGLYTGKGKPGEATPEDSCAVGVPSGVKLAERRYIVDESIGAVAVLLEFGNNQLPDVHAFRIEKGKIRYVHTMTVCKSENCGLQLSDDIKKRLAD